MHGIRIRAHPARIALSTIALCRAGGGKGTNPTDPLL